MKAKTRHRLLTVVSFVASLAVALDPAIFPPRWLPYLRVGTAVALAFSKALHDVFGG